MLKSTDLQKVTTICRNAGIDYLALFGSYARGDYHEDSDVDLLVNFKETQSYFEKARVLLNLQDTLNKEVDLVSYKNIKPNRKPYIMRDAVTIYDER
ncbi:hypothetical protein COT50_01125 [candidate division WWE3 bacterium CG08_land_8_20_14_0_20_41_10]|uniref:Polymerase beta nucleotidyltransferase domain-containing protein n=1 Tax=candidate division WWE3 bacterium CG08_land_8_20_14_0_20_41_10 TaxID=1975085 RepID=A0A2H0XEK8_UNCKA|nr:MAG: hypothetical protein COT50_01125 [candidate division WWE3 bacterium CG08_land_8_20_14_0_20_41_10]